MKSVKWVIFLVSFFISFRVDAFVTGDIVITKEDVVRVYDGDTFYVNIRGIHEVFGKEIGVRILGIDTPEIRSSCESLADKILERDLAERAKLLLEEQLMTASIIVIKSPTRDKYFRIDAVVFADGVDVREKLIASELQSLITAPLRSLPGALYR